MKSIEKTIDGYKMYPYNEKCKGYKLYPNKGGENMRIRLKEERKKQKLTQKELAERLDISEVWVKKIENGVSHPGRNLMFKFEEFFGISHRELFPDLFEQNGDTFCIKRTG
jgi:putative transcriptional regulator